MTGYEAPLFGPAHERALHEAGQVAVSNAALGLRFGIKQAAAWRMLAELVRRHPRLQILEGHAAGGTYDELVAWDIGDETSAVRCNYVGRVHLSPCGGDARAYSWIDVLTMSPRDLVGEAEARARLLPPGQLPRSSPRVLTYRAIAHLAGATAFDRHGLRLVNGVCDSAGYHHGIREESFREFPAIDEHRRAADEDSPYEWGEYRFWFAYTDTPDGLGEPLLAFESTGHAWKPGPDGDSFDFNRTYASVGRNFDVLLSAFDAWRAD